MLVTVLSLLWPFTGEVGDCELPTRHGAVQGLQPWGYKPGSKNLFGAMAARVDEALNAAPEGSHLGGMLWYQVSMSELTRCSADSHRSLEDVRLEVLVGRS